MTTDDGVQLVFLALLMVLVGRAILNRSLPVGRMFTYLLVWAAVIGVAFLLFGAAGNGTG